MMKSITVVASALLVLFWAASGDAMEVHHDLRISIDPKTQRLTGFDRLQIQPGGVDRLVFGLNDAVENLQVMLAGHPVSFQMAESRLVVDLPVDLRKRKIQLDISYAAVFDDPVPVMPVNTDNPGYGVSASISERGTLLLAGSGWYPHLNGNRVTYRLQVEAPAGWVAVTAGRGLGIAARDQKTVSSWQVDHPVRGLALSLARFEVKKKTVGDVSAETYFFSENKALADAYLAAIVDYLELYEDLFGPYPFPKFAVVENFFPTGYGFASYTLIGSRVLRLPFIIATSLGHEIAHCWWGNGVYVDYTQGNWSEALTTYVADYLYKERRSPTEAADYRRQMLRNYASLVAPASDFPLARFMSRTDPLTKTIGYDKGAMVFHMLRRKIGDPAFWDALRDVYRASLFKPVSWTDLQNAFEKRSGTPLQSFFDQWVRRGGAPRLSLEGVKLEPADNGWRVSGRINQTGNGFELTGELVLDTAAGRNASLVEIAGPATAFTIEVAARPRRLHFDPDTQVFRRLDPAEIPPTVNSIKGAGPLKVILAEDLDSELDSATETLLRSLGLRDFQVISEQALNREAANRSDLLFIGLPRNTALLSRLPPQVRLERTNFSLNSVRHADPRDAFFGVMAHPHRADRVVGLFIPNSAGAAETAARKITHYGKYSYLVFHDGQNVAKGTWPVTTSPLNHHFEP